ncbi:MAG: PKD domain-containing protein [Flavisolibacter sp.]|nr:PKD domain-containing protein [Flavisolibacter sp.]
MELSTNYLNHSSYMENWSGGLTSGIKKRLKLSSFFTTFSCLIVGMLFSTFSYAQFSPDDCNKINCTSNDVRIINAYLSGPGNTAIDCSAEHPFENAELHLIVFSNTQRVGVSISGTLTADGADYPIGNCFKGKKLNSGSNNDLIFNLSTQLSNATCESSFSLSNQFISWGTGNTDFCTSNNPQCPATPAKCRYVAGSIPVDIKLDVDFSWVAGDCTKQEDGLTLKFTPSVTATGITYPLTFDWDFGDGSTDETSAADAGTVSAAGTTHTYASAGTYTVKLTVTDNTSTPIEKKTQHTVTVESCCNLAAPNITSGIGPFCSAEGKRIGDLPQSDGNGGTYNWFDGPDPATSFELDPTTVIPIGSNDYYVSVSKDGCESERVKVTVVVYKTPNAPSVTAGPFCSAEGKTIGDLPQGGAYKYYDAQTGGNLLTGSTVIPIGNNQYWVSTTSSDGCESSRSTVTVMVNQSPTLTVMNLTNQCPSKTVNLADAKTGGTGTLSYFLSNGTTPVTNPSAVGAGTYWLVLTANGCTDKKKVTVNITICQGCTPGYWKNRKESWSTIKTTNDELNCVNTAAGASVTGELKNASFWKIFGLESLTTSQREERTGKGTANLTLLGAVGLGDGSGYTQLARAATAALLNSCALKGTGAYPYAGADIINETKNIFSQPVTASSRQAALDFAKKYDIANNGVCTIDNSGKTVASVASPQSNIVDVVPKLSVTAYPNPFSDKVKFVITSPVSGQATLELYNTMGQKVRIVFQGRVTAGLSQIIEYNVPPVNQNNLMYILRMNGEQVSGKLMNVKK